jgi:hypothetical protein
VFAVVGLVGVAAVVLDGAPAFGSDFGGVLSLVPAFALLALRAGEVRVSLVRLGLVALAAVAAVSAFAVADYLRPPDSRSHLGRFVAQVVDGDAATIIRRKLHANLDLLTHSVLTLLVPVAVAFLALLLFRPRGGLRQAIERSPEFEAGLLAVLALQLVGFAANDSGVAIPALSMTVVVPLALAVAIRATEDPVGAPISDAVSHKSGDRLIR